MVKEHLWMAAYGISDRFKAKKIFPHFFFTSGTILFTYGTMFPFVLNIKTNDEVKIFVSRLFCFFLQHQETVGLRFQLLHL